MDEFIKRMTQATGGCLSTGWWLVAIGYGLLKGGRSTALQRKSHLCIPFLGIARPQSFSGNICFKFSVLFLCSMGGRAAWLAAMLLAIK